MDKNELEKFINDHDLLIEINVKLNMLLEQFSNHLKHHNMYTKMALGAGLVGIINFTIGLVFILLRFISFGK